MRKWVERVRAKWAYWGARLNALQATIVAYIIVNPSAPREAVNAVVPEQYRPIAAVLVAFVAWLVVNAASNSDAKKATNNARP